MEPTKQHQDKSYIKSKKKWADFKINQDLIDALIQDGKHNPTRVQAEALQIALDPDRKKFNLLLRAANGAGKTMAFLIPIMNAIRQGISIAEDKNFRGKIQKDEIFKPQGIIIVQTNILQDQIIRILKAYNEIGQVKESQKLKFRVGRMDKQKHEPGQIIIAMPKSFLNRHQRGNLKLDQCKFIAIDEVDDTYQQQKDTLAQILKICQKSPANIITCSATMKKQFLEYYGQNCKDFIKFNINDMVKSQTNSNITLEGVTHYYHKLNTKQQMHKFIISTLYKHFYLQSQKKPQMFVFFDSIQQINSFHQYFKARQSDLMGNQVKYLQKLSIDIVAANKYKDGKKQPMTIQQKNKAMTLFRNEETTILLATNIIARGIDVRKACFVINVGPPKRSEKDYDFDYDIYLHRVGRTGRHNDRGIALTLLPQNDVDKLCKVIKAIHKIEMKQMKDPADIAKQVRECMLYNSQ